MKYTIFTTSWGYFGLVGTEKWVLQTYLPVKTSVAIEKNILKRWGDIRFEPSFLKGLQQRICAYFEGQIVDFSDVETFADSRSICCDDGITDNSNIIGTRSSFTKAVWANCRTITYGTTISYSHLAALCAHPLASRAAGNILSANPTPLIVACHRVIRSDGGIGGFSAAGGQGMKGKMLNLEKTRLGRK